MRGYTKIDGREALAMLLDGETVFSRNEEPSWMTEDFQKMFYIPEGKKQKSVCYLTFNDIVEFDWYIQIKDVPKELKIYGLKPNVMICDEEVQG